MTALAQLYALYSHRARSFNQWQHALYPNFIINSHRARSFNQCNARYIRTLLQNRAQSRLLYLLHRARYTNDGLLYMAAPKFYNGMKTDRYFLYDLFNYLKSFHHPTEQKFHLTWGWKSSKTMSLADELQFYQVQKIIFRLLFCNSSSRSVEDDSSLVGCSTRRLTI